jgi:hypothetical protein
MLAETQISSSSSDVQQMEFRAGNGDGAWGLRFALLQDQGAHQ